MLSVRAEDLGFSYTDRTPILQEGRFHLSPGWYGLVGANGMGKTTLARLVNGELRPTTGRLWVEPANARVTICRQELTELDDDITEFAASTDGSSGRLRGIFGLELAHLAEFSRLSPGQRKRWQLATALANAPEVLILDEPTNHLDAEGRERLLSALRSFTGIGIAISHDRDFLDELTRTTLRLSGQTVGLYAGSYSQARVLWETERRQTEELRQQRRQQEQRLQQRVAEAGQKRRAASHQRSGRTRMKNIHDHDGSSFVMAGRAAMGEAAVGRRVRVLNNALERARDAVPQYVVDKTLGTSVFVDYQPSPKRRLMALRGEDVGVGQRRLLQNVSLALERDSRVHLRGPNGSGKTTLLKTLLGRATVSPQRLLYLPQELGSAEMAELCAEVGALPRAERGRVLSILASLGVDPTRIQDRIALSPGEARKLKMAVGLATLAFALLLDEPTNHLDLDSIERLETALSAYPGALLLVTHDTALARRCTHQVWEIRDQRVVL